MIDQKVVKITQNEDGDAVTEPVWCLVDVASGSDMAFCSGEVFGLGDGVSIYTEKLCKKGSVTCTSCMARIKEIKRYRF